jgi:hypothetical protein
LVITFAAAFCGYVIGSFEFEVSCPDVFTFDGDDGPGLLAGLLVEALLDAASSPHPKPITAANITVISKKILTITSIPALFPAG